MWKEEEEDPRDILVPYMVYVDLSEVCEAVWVEAERNRSRNERPTIQAPQPVSEQEVIPDELETI